MGTHESGSERTRVDKNAREWSAHENGGERMRVGESARDSGSGMGVDESA